MRPLDLPWDIVTYRACALCDHGKSGVCKRPEVRGQRADGVPFSEARRDTGPCGRDAYYLVFPGLYRPGEHP